MGRSKLAKFKDNDESPLVVQPGKELYEQIQGNWKTDFFQNEQPITLEVGCGKGEYTIGLASRFPDRSFIGADIKGSRIWKGAKVATQQELTNVGFIRTKIEFIDRFFAEDELDEIWITFPDPRPKDRDIKRRLTSPRFMAMYQKMLKPRGTVHFKTDNLPLFEYTLDEVLPTLSIEGLEFTKDLYSSDLLDDIRGIRTHYEQLFSAQGFKINYLRFRFSA